MENFVFIADLPHKYRGGFGVSRLYYEKMFPAGLRDREHLFHVV